MSETQLQTVDQNLEVTPRETTVQTVKIAKEIKSYMDRKEKKVLFNGQRYPELDDWQFAAAFYGLKTVTESSHINIAGVDGFKAKARVIDAHGIEVGGAESCCMKDEPNWKSKPLFQLASMAQTRAASKALSNLLRPLMKLAGYATTPAEEMIGTPQTTTDYMPKKKEVVKDEDIPFGEPLIVTHAQEALEGKITDKQAKMLFARWHQAGFDDAALKKHLSSKYQLEHTKDLHWKQFKEILEMLDSLKDESANTGN